MLPGTEHYRTDVFRSNVLQLVWLCRDGQATSTECVFQDNISIPAQTDLRGIGIYS
jgi:hypothetical protein